MVEIRSVPESDVEAVHHMRNDRIDDESLETVRGWYRQNPELFVGAYDAGDLVGFCTGHERVAGAVSLNGIAVEKSSVCRGIGTTLLAAFEERVVSLDYERIGVGSAGGYVDEFYLQNDYEPSAVLVRNRTEDLPNGYRDLEYEIVEEKIEDGTQKLYIEAHEHDPERVEEIQDAFNDPSAIYIMEKRLTDLREVISK